MKKICGIYKITNTINGKMYIGQSVDIEKRISSHFCNRTTPTTNLHKDIKLYGSDNFVWSVICEVPKQTLDIYESNYIKYYNTIDDTFGYNKTSGGVFGFLFNEEIKKEMSRKRKGAKLSTDACENIRKAKLGEKNPNFGIKQTLETIQKRLASNPRVGREFSFEGLIFSNKEELAKYIGVSNRTIYRMVNDGRVRIEYV